MATSKVAPAQPGAPTPPPRPTAPRPAAVAAPVAKTPPPRPAAAPTREVATASPFTDGFTLEPDRPGQEEPSEETASEAVDPTYSAQEEPQPVVAAAPPKPTAAPPRRAPDPPRTPQVARPQARPAAAAAPVSQAIEVRQTQTVVNAREDVPDFLRDRVGDRSGTEDVERGDLTLPRLGLCQALTPQKKQSAGSSYIPGLQDGQFFNSVTNDVYGSWVKVVPLFFYKTRIKFNPLNEGGGIDCQSLDGKTGGHYSPSDCIACNFSQFNDNDAPLCSLFHNFLSLIVDSELMSFDDKPELTIVSFHSTGLKVSKQWNAQVRMTNLPMYAKVYEVSSTEVSGNGNTWSQYVVRPGPYVDQNFFTAAEQYFKAYRDQKVQIDTRGMDAETESEASFNTAAM